MRGRDRASPTAAIGAAVAVAGLLGSCGIGSSRTIDPASAGRFISTQLASRYPVGHPIVVCPKGIQSKAGQTFECSTTLDEQRVSIAVSVTDNRGHFTAEPTAAVIDVASASSLLQKQISATAHAPTIVRCGSLPVLVVAPGTSFACTAKVGSQASRALTVTVEDLQGNVRFDLAPAAPAPIRG